MGNIIQSGINARLNWCPRCAYGPELCIRYTPHDGNCLYWLSKNSSKSKKKLLSDGAVDWYIPGRKHPFMRTSSADAKLIYSLYLEDQDLRKVYDKIVDSESAKKVVMYYIKRKVYRLELKK